MSGNGPADDCLERLYDPEEFRRHGHAAIDLLADYLARCRRRELPVLPWQEPEAAVDFWSEEGKPACPEEVLPFFGQYLDRSLHLHHPGYAGHQVSPAAPLAALGSLVAAVANNSLAVYETGPAGTALEETVIRWLCRTFGLPAGAGGVLTSGGSAGNLTGLLAARQSRWPGNAWEDGTMDGRPPAVLVSSDCHYSMTRAAKILGWGEAAVYRLPLDGQRRIIPGELPRILETVRAAGREVLVLAGNACSTATGAFDPLEELADFCATRGIWFHVDAAHGGGAALVPQYRHLVRGLNRADSFIVDFHKMLMCPSLCTAVLFRDNAASWSAFSQQAAYLLAGRKESPWDLAARTLECTKPALALPAVTLLKAYGTAAWTANLERTFGLAREFAGLIRACADFRLAVEPQANIVCFRHEPAGCPDGELDRLNAHLRRAIRNEGRYFLVQTPVDGRLYLRATLMNPFTTREDLLDLLDRMRSLARRPDGEVFHRKEIQPGEGPVCK